MFPGRRGAAAFVFASTRHPINAAPRPHGHHGAVVNGSLGKIPKKTAGPIRSSRNRTAARNLGPEKNRPGVKVGEDKNFETLLSPAAPTRQYGSPWEIIG
jgi:hypothetical protein